MQVTLTLPPLISGVSIGVIIPEVMRSYRYMHNKNPSQKDKEVLSTIDKGKLSINTTWRKFKSDFKFSISNISSVFSLFPKTPQNKSFPLSASKPN